MIKFITDYTTKSLPPEKFEQGQEVKRSTESELYLVQLGVAGYVVDGQLVDQDYQPIVVRTTVVEVVSPGDRRFADGGRGGERLGLDAPQRSSTGPGTAAVFSTTSAIEPANGELHGVEIEQLRSDLATSMQQLDDHRGDATKQIDALTADLTAAQGARETAQSQLAAAQADATALRTRVTELEAQLVVAKNAPTADRPGRGK